MKFGSFTLAIAALLLAAPSSTDAFSGGAGGCAGGQAAVNGLHLRAGATTGGLSDGDVTMNVGGTDITAGATVEAAPGDEVSITATAGGEPIRGILIRLESTTGEDLTGVLAGEDAGLLQDAAVCSAPVTGVTHTSPVDKRPSALA